MDEITKIDRTIRLGIYLETNGVERERTISLMFRMLR